MHLEVDDEVTITWVGDTEGLGAVTQHINVQFCNIAPLQVML